MRTEKFQKLLIELNACEEAREWAADNAVRFADALIQALNEKT